MDLNYYHTDVGMAIISSAIFDDLAGWMIFSVILGTVGISGGMPAAATVILAVLFAVGMLTVGRWGVHRALPWILAHTSWPGGVLSFAVSLAFIGAAFTEWIGIHAVFGSFMVGVALGDSEHMRKRTQETLEQFVSFIFAPLFFVSIGLKVDFVTSFDPMLTALVLVIAMVGKVAGCGFGARASGMPWRESWAIGFGMNARGAMEIILALLAMQYGIIGERMFVALVIMALATSIASGPVMQMILRKPKQRQVSDFLSSHAYLNPLKGKTVQEAVAELSGLVAGAYQLDAREIEKSVMGRERLAPTGLGFGVAIPHAHLADLSKEGVDFNAADGKPAHLLFFILTPKKDMRTQVEILSEISRIVKNTELCDRIKKAASFTELLGLIKTKEV
jgi:mannitol/fructose-specific phosphotransferase system IIA component (Ntr-type)